MGNFISRNLYSYNRIVDNPNNDGIINNNNECLNQ